MSNESSIFKGRKAALLTKHEKETVIKPVLENATGCEVFVDKSYDTDQFGTFTLEIPRIGSQLETARRKAYKAMELTGMDIGLASEGSFGPHPSIPFLPWNVEIVILVDSKEKLEIYGVCANSETNFKKDVVVSSFKEAEEFAHKVGFPSHYLILRTNNGMTDSFIKGINSWEWLAEAVERELSQSITGKISLETDMRAHANPSRMANIRIATEDLAKKIRQLCPKCGTPGFSLVDKKRGLPCEWCGMPTREVLADIYACQRCGFLEEHQLSVGETASARSCEFCNP